MLFSNVVMYFIMLATAAKPFKAGQTEIQSAREAAEALCPLAGLARQPTPGRRRSAERPASIQKPGRARPFYGVIVGATGVGLLLNFLEVNPIPALFWRAVISGFLAPPLLVVIMRVANRPAMGHRVSGMGLNVLGWTATALMWAAAIGLVVTWDRS
jgi:Mn2+/Fe2+ NRAMP family transporter